MKAPPKLTVFDVGHGSCVFLQDGTVSTVVDCKDSTQFIEYLLSRNISAVSQIIISHADADHIAGILALIQSDYIKLGSVFVNNDASKNTDAWLQLRIALQDASDRGKLKVCTEIGDGMIGQLVQGDVRIEVVAPGIAARLSGAGGRTPQLAKASSNTMSVVLRLHHENHPVMLLPGDLDHSGLTDLLARSKHLGCDILLFPHHGGHIGHGSSPAKKEAENAAFARALLAQARPKLVLFSIGRGRFGTPRPEIVREVTAQPAGCHIHCTQLSEHCHRKALVAGPSHLADLPAVGRESNQCCGGSLEITFAGKNTTAGIDRKALDAFIVGSVETPLCRSAATPHVHQGS